ncbi:MAG: TonB-dependent receptor [Bacteroidia bacterium]|nr:TonB-dependent receptor [Bacteroidia bacterium]
MRNLAKLIRVVAFCFLLIQTTLTLAQSSVVSGVAIDSSNQKPLEYTSVVLLKSSDSSNVAFTFTEPDGRFEFKNIKEGSYVLQLYYTGYNLQSVPLVLSANQTKALGNIVLAPSSMRLSTALVNAKSIPIAVKGDTLVYNPNAFKTKNNATVEDLLKKLPGVQVNKSGEVIAQGEKVVKVLVNGKEFFGNDPTKATQNLDAESLQKVEVLDKKSDDAEFTGVDDGEREKVINLVLKKEANKGAFGKIEAGGGTEETYFLKGTYNYFKDENQITAIGNLNNLNQNGFDWREYYEMLNGANGVNFGQRTYWYNQNQWLGNNEQGRQTNAVLGTNAHLKIGKKGKLEASYFLMGRENQLETNSTSENYLPNTVILSNSEYNSSSTNGQNKALLEYTWRPDTLTWLEMGFEGDVSSGTTQGFSFTDNANDEGSFLNTSMSKTENAKRNENLKGQMTYRRKIKGTGHSFSFQVGAEHNFSGDTSQWVSNYSLDEVEYSPSLPFQFMDQVGGTGDILYGRGAVMFELDTNVHLHLAADNKMTLGTYEMVRNDLTQQMVIEGQSPFIETNYRVSKFNARYSRNRRKKNGWYYNLGLGAINIDVQRDLTKADTQSFDKGYWMPTLHFYFSYNKRKNVRFGTWFSTTENFPNTNQVNPIANIQNPINITQGDIRLDPYVNYNWGGNYNHSNRAKNRYLQASIWTSFAPNPTIRNQTRDTNNVSFTTFLNDRSTNSQNTELYYSFLLKKLNLEVALNLGASNYTYFTILNDVYYKNQNATMRAGLELTFELEDLEIYAEYQPDYSVQVAGFTAQNPSYWTHNFNVELVYDITDRLQFSSEYDVYYFNAQQVGQTQLVPLLNSELSWTLDSNARWTIGLAGFDMLNKNQSIDRNFYGSTYSETRQNTITRFFMLKVKYSIRRGKKKQPQRRQWF